MPEETPELAEREDEEREDAGQGNFARGMAFGLLIVLPIWGALGVLLFGC